MDTYIFTDDNVAEDNFHALLSFYEKFPIYKHNPLWISGESYAGIYVPTLTEKLHDSNLFNLKGFLVGNGVFNVTGLSL